MLSTKYVVNDLKKTQLAIHLLKQKEYVPHKCWTDPALIKVQYGYPNVFCEKSTLDTVRIQIFDSYSLDIVNKKS